MPPARCSIRCGQPSRAKFRTALHAPRNPGSHRLDLAANCAASPPTPRRSNSIARRLRDHRVRPRTNTCCATRIAASASSPTATSGNLPRAPAISTSSTCSSSTARWAATAGTSSDGSAGYAGGAAPVGHLSHDVDAAGIRLRRVWLKALATVKFAEAAAHAGRFPPHPSAVGRHCGSLRRTQRFKPVAIVVHNRRDLWRMKYLYGMRQRLRPPAVLSRRQRGRGHPPRGVAPSFPMLDGVPTDAALIGVFGFIGEYKGIETVIHALHYLPDNHHLLIFGGVHPQEIAPRQPTTRYIVVAVRPRLRRYDALRPDDRRSARPSTPTVSVAVDRARCASCWVRTRAICRTRIHFLGALGETIS